MSEYEVSVHTRDDRGFTSLHRAAEFGDNETITLLPDIKLDERTKTGLTALHLAARNGHSTIVEQLLARMPSLINLICCHTGKTAVEYAAQNGHDDIVAMLIPNARTDSLEAALDSAVSQGHEPMVTRLLAHNSGLVTNENLLIMAAGQGSISIAAQLLALKPDLLSSPSNDDQTPLHVAAGCGHEAMVSWLLGLKPEWLDKKDYKGKIPLHWACQFARERMVALLLSHKPAVVDGRCCFEVMAMPDHRSQETMLNMLLAYDPTLIDCVCEQFEGNSLLHFAFDFRSGTQELYGHEFMQKLWQMSLLTERVVHVVNEMNRTPLQQAVKRNNTFAIELIHTKYTAEELVQSFAEHKREFPRVLLDKYFQPVLLLLHPDVVSIVYEYVGTAEGQAERRASKRKLTEE